MKQTHKYDDIINLPRPVSKRHAPMAMLDRAAQFSPFAALTGYDAVIREAGRQSELMADPESSRKADRYGNLQWITNADNTE